MLLSLHIEHFAIVKKLDLDFDSGMTVFTGETGAGKSIMIDALMLVLGERADASVVRPGEKKCDLSACFKYDVGSETASWLKQHDLDGDSQDGLYLRRVINDQGRSKAYINGQPVALHQLKELGEKLVHIHGQHQHQTLLRHATHREQLDEYANHRELLEELAALFKQHSEIKQALDMLHNETHQADKIKLLQFQIEELAALNVKPNEVETLYQEHQLLHHAKEYLTWCEQAHDLLYEQEQHALCALLNRLLEILRHLPQDKQSIKNTMELVQGALIQCEEAIFELKSFSESVELNPERLNQVEERMSAIHLMARKYQVDGKNLFNHQMLLQTELSGFDVVTEKRKALHQQLNQIQQRYHELAAKLNASRHHHAVKLADELTRSIQKLGMPKGRIEIQVETIEKMHPHGMDRIEYKVCTNPGMELDALSKVVSGGELSRISLAIQMITAQKGCTPTLLFDEVDVGIGGATAALVGHMLQNLGKRLQVFCVTHQPQVAACADNHFQVLKQCHQEQTYTEVTLLHKDEKINEIARMLGGLSITEHTRSHAKELLNQANKSIMEKA